TAVAGLAPNSPPGIATTTPPDGDSHEGAMAKPQTETTEDIQVKKHGSIQHTLNELHEMISRRAYELFENGGLFAGPLADWFRAERELISRPPIELRQKDGQFELDAALPGIDPKQLDVQVTPEDVLITATEEHRNERKEGT